MYIYSDQVTVTPLSAQRLHELLLDQIKSPHQPGNSGDLVGVVSSDQFSFRILYRSQKGRLNLELYGSYHEREGGLEVKWNTRLSTGTKLILFALMPAGVLLCLDHEFIALWALVIVLHAFTYARERSRLHERLSKLYEQPVSKEADR